MSFAPVVLFVYNRLWHTQQTIEALQRNEQARDTELFIYCDATKDEKTKNRVQEVRDYVHTIEGFKSIHIIERETNWGLAASIIDGVTTVVNDFGRVIVLEDDLQTSPLFLEFMNFCLNKYKEHSEVMHVSGYFYPVVADGLPDTFFIKPTTCWGWGTWADSWKYFEKNPQKLIETFTTRQIRDLNLNDSYNYWEAVSANFHGKLNTWAIFWYASVFLAGGLSLHPKVSYCRNIGMDGSGVHCDENTDYETLLSNTRSQLTEDIQLHRLAEQRLEAYFRSIQPSLVSRVIRKVKRLFQ